MALFNLGTHAGAQFVASIFFVYASSSITDFSAASLLFTSLDHHKK